MTTLKFGRKVATESRAKFFAGIEGRKDDWRREHLGASLIGHRCDRYLWLTFRWAGDPDHGGKQLRLFERGLRAESWLIEDLRAAGFRVHDREYGEQLRVSWGHFGGHLDGVVLGVPEAPETPHVLETKTFNLKSFLRLVEKGVKSAKPEHWAQMQTYMGGKKIERALYVAVCKDNDEIYIERVDYDASAANGFIARGQWITMSVMEPPARLDPEQPPCVLVSKDGARWPCQYFDLCHGTQRPERNCRTCADSTPLEGGGWSCGRLKAELTVEAQKTGCGEQLTIPAIVNAQVETIHTEGRIASYRFADGLSYIEAPRRTQ